MNTTITVTEDQFKQAADSLGITTEAGLACLRVFLENAKLIESKQKDYGPGNISNFGLFGVIVRMNDKFERLKNLCFTKDASGNVVMKTTTPAHESVEDTIRDICGYAGIATVVKNGNWPGLKK